MKLWQYFVVFLVLFGCSGDPAPEDSYFISQADYSVEEGVPAVIPEADSSEIIVLPDSLSEAADSSLSAFPMGDSLYVSEDSLFCREDSLEQAVDSIPLIPPEHWRFAEIEIQGSLYQSLESIEDVQSDILGAHCVRNLVWEMNPWRGFIAGDSIRLLYTTEELPRENMVLAFEYIPVAGSSNHPFSGYVFKKSGDNWSSVWKADGSELVLLLNRMPVGTFEEITSVFGEPRGNHVHQGVDFKAPSGTAVFSVTGGTVIRTNWNTDYNGYCIEIDFGGYTEIFLHLDSIESSVVAGASIASGAQVGTVGNTGISTAPHLHYQINGADGYAIDPYLYFSSHRRSLSADDMTRFSEQVVLYRSMMGD